jgi:hypothetical protein
MMLAGLFWLLTKFSQQYEYNIQVGLQVTNYPADLVLVSRIPEQASLRVKGTGWELLRYYVQLRKPEISLNLAQYTDEKAIPLSGNPSLWAENLPYKFQVLGAVPSFIALDFEPLTSRQIPVKLVSDIQLNAQYGLVDSVRYTPSAVTVTGPESLVNEIEFIPTVPLVLSDLKATATGSLDLLQDEISNISLVPAAIQYEVAVEQYTEASISISIGLKGSDGKQVQLKQTQATVEFQIPVNRFSQMNRPDFADQFQIVADFTHTAKEDTLVPLVITAAPPYVRKTVVRPSNAGFYFKRL